jgi:RimJ/RimL family protein N-acetyltransferase
VTETLAIRSLGPDDAMELSVMLTAQRPEYLQYFTPFALDVATLTRVLSTKVRDVYLGLYWEGRLAAFCMLRGWDEGYEVPALGVVVAEEYRGKGVGTLTLELARVISRLRGSSELMLKVHPRNEAARALYIRAGFRETEVDPRTGNIVMLQTLSPISHPHHQP